MAVISAGFETGVNGNTIATSDAGDLTAFDSVTIVAGGTLAYDNTHAAHGRLAAKVATGATSGQTSVDWTTAFGTQTDHYGRVYFYFTANPAIDIAIVTIFNGATAAIRLQLRTTGLLRILDSGSVDRGALTTAVSLNQWVRVEFHVVHNTTTGTAEIKLFNTPDSTTVTDSVLSGSFNSEASANQIRFGLNGGANIGPYWQDAILAAASAYPGPKHESLVEASRTSRNSLLRRCSGILFPPLWLPTRSEPVFTF